MRIDEKTESIVRKIEGSFEGGSRSELLINFAEALYRRGVADDLTRYPASDLARLAEGALAFFRQRTPGRQKTRVFNPEVSDSSHLGDITVIEIANDDMPFLVDSTLGLLNERGHVIHLVLHPIMAVKRDSENVLIAVDSRLSRGSSEVRESFIHIHIGRITDEGDRAALERDIISVMKDVRTVVLDWRSMHDRLSRAVNDYQTAPPPVAVEELAESIQFLQWLLDNHFTFLGMREYAFEGDAGEGQLKAVKSSGAGILRDPKVQVLRRGGELVEITPEVRQFLNEPAPLIITKANVRATVHRRAYMDYVGVKQFGDDGALRGELRVIGLFTSAAYTRSARQIPLLRRKVLNVVEQSGFESGAHSGKALLNILETFPRDELFQIDVNSLTETALGILQLDERPRTRIFVRRDRFDRFVSALVYVPRDRFNTVVRARVGDYLAEVYDGHVSAYYPWFPEGPLVRVHYVIGRTEGETPEPDLRDVEENIAELVRTWDDRFTEAVETAYATAEAREFLGRYRGGFSVAYQEAFSRDDAVNAIAEMERLGEPGALSVTPHHGPDDGGAAFRLKLYHLGEPIPLSDRLPILENLGLRSINERTFRITRQPKTGPEDVILHEVLLETMDGHAVDLEDRGGLLTDGFLAVWSRKAENDGYNALILREGMTWREAALMRACGKYLRQAAIPFSADYMAATLVKHSSVARMLLRLFHVRFDPGVKRGKVDGMDHRAREAAAILDEIDSVLAEVPSLDEDRIIRRFANLIMSILRTNYFCRDDEGNEAPTMAFKINSRDVDGLPEPKPFAEIFVYSPDVEGIHLRGGKISRGGLRWSDRLEDFRTEVLGLAKAQNVKNAVIVPVGAKGGFVVKRPPPGGGREELLAEGVRCYRLFISSLLEITDNLEGDRIVPPKGVLRHDDDDPYLVVAADKGTATFSDIANEISINHNFWMSDAFASGGSAGYDHKKMGITARGAWEAVKRHFREMDIDIQTTPFTVIGIGDMSGDVFGNGMLLSKQIKLIAAFDHRDIFIDPDPDPAKSFAERERLFALPRSTWQDYSKKLISKGGGVFSRQAKSISLSPEIQALTGLSAATATPNEVLGALLKAPTDLLWLGGIGTYVRASDENDADVGDRTNDAIRVTAQELKARVVGEGANLGLTQRARVEFAMRGGRVNTDAVDNSAGVNSSDMEVNIKILFRAAEEAGSLKRSQRNKLLEKMTEDVAALVLRNNYLQSLCLTLAQATCLEELGFHSRLMRALEQRGLLDRAIEYLPDDVALLDRQANGQGLTRPELAVLMAYAKIVLFDQILESDVPDDDYLARELYRYFPDRLAKPYGKEMEGHRLRREIIATMLANSMINRGGPAFVFRLEDEAGSDVASIAAAYAAARDCFGFTELNGMVDALDNRILGALQTELYLELQRLMRAQTNWFLRNAPFRKGLARIVRHYAKGLGELREGLTNLLPAQSLAEFHRRIAELTDAGVPDDSAQRLAALRFLARGPDIVLVATETKHSVCDVGRSFFRLGSELQIARLMERANRMGVVDYYERMAVGYATDGVVATQRVLTKQLLAKSVNGSDGWQEWAAKNAHAVERINAALFETLAGELTVAKLSVIGSMLSDMATRAGR